jgi:hypothetical protein
MYKPLEQPTLQVVVSSANPSEQDEQEDLLPSVQTEQVESHGLQVLLSESPYYPSGQFAKHLSFAKNPDLHDKQPEEELHVAH